MGAGFQALMTTLMRRMTRRAPRRRRRRAPSISDYARKFAAAAFVRRTAVLLGSFLAMAFPFDVTVYSSILSS